MMVRRIQERKSWSDIHRDILEEITRKLTLVDYLKCRQICRSWRCAIDDALIKNKYVTRASSVPLHASQFPFLILFPSTFYHNSPHDPAITAILSDITQEDICYTLPTKTWEGYFDFDGILPRWIEVDDLGDRILLMDDTGIQVLSAKEIKLPGELNGGNFVFFVDNILFMKWQQQQQQQHDFGVFSLKDKTITRFPLGRSSQVPGLIRCLWFMPSLW